MRILFFLLELFWLLIACSLILQYAEYCIELSFFEKLLVMIIFTIGAPCFLIVNILTSLLDVILPNGWEDDDNDFLGGK